jgi:hypothetical protein
MYNSIQIYEPEHFGNGWGFYVDIENPHIPIVKHGFVSGKYPKNYYSSNDKIDEELEYYEYEYNKKREEESKNFEESNIIKTNSSSLLFNISSLTLLTAALSYCFLAAL